MCLFGVGHSTHAQPHHTGFNCTLHAAQGGGFCGARTRKLGLDLSRFDGLRLRVKGDGQTFKLNVKTVRALQLCVCVCARV